MVYLKDDEVNMTDVHPGCKLCGIRIGKGMARLKEGELLNADNSST